MTRVEYGLCRMIRPSRSHNFKLLDQSGMGDRPQGRDVRLVLKIIFFIAQVRGIYLGQLVVVPQRSFVVRTRRRPSAARRDLSVLYIIAARRSLNRRREKKQEMRMPKQALLGSSSRRRLLLHGTPVLSGLFRRRCCCSLLVGLCSMMKVMIKCLMPNSFLGIRKILVVSAPQLRARRT